MPARHAWGAWRLLGVVLVLCGLLASGGRGLAAGCDPATFPVLVDAGHGPRRSGAESARGVPEYAFNTRLAKRVVAALRAAGFIRAALLDPEGEDLSPTARAARANTQIGRAHV